MTSKRKQVDPYPCMARGETEFEEKRIEAEFTLAFGRVVQLGLSDLRGTYEYVFRAGYFSGKARTEFEQGDGSPKYPSYIKIL